MIPKSGTGFRIRSCFINKLGRDGDSKKSRPALADFAAAAGWSDQPKSLQINEDAGLQKFLR